MLKFSIKFKFWIINFPKPKCKVLYCYNNMDPHVYLLSVTDLEFTCTIYTIKNNTS